MDRGRGLGISNSSRRHKAPLMPAYYIGIDPGVEKHGIAVLEYESDTVVSLIQYGHFARDQVAYVLDDNQGSHTHAVAVEIPVYQGPARTQKQVLRTSFSAGRFVEYCYNIFTTFELTPADWKQILWGKKSGVTESMVELYVQGLLGHPVEEPKSKRVHINDAICLAAAARLKYTGG